MKVEEMLLTILETKDITQEELAYKLNISPAQVSRLLGGKNKPHRKTYAKIKKMYNELAEM